MRVAIKRKGFLIRACRPGGGSTLEQELIKAETVRRHKHGVYEEFSREPADDSGELVHVGDYVKLDPWGKTYPNLRAFWLKRTTLVRATGCMNRPAPVGVRQLQRASMTL